MALSRWQVTAKWGSAHEVYVVRARGRIVSAATNAGASLPLDTTNEHQEALPTIASSTTSSHKRLGQVRSTAIAGNDLTSSCLYTAGVCATVAGPLAPVALLLVSALLYLYRAVYAEVVTALPQNGGCYNALLNTGGKRAASLAACLSMLSYVATAVVSASDAMVYLSSITHIDVRAGTIVVLAIFAALCLLGVTESSVVAVGMFTVHVLTMSTLIVWCIVWAAQDNGETLRSSLSAGFPAVASTDGRLLSNGTVFGALFFGFSSALLGITGFESAANFVEEVKDAQVYVRTVRNLWLAVSLFNPALSFMSMCVLPLPEVYLHSSDLLAAMAARVGGPVFRTCVAVDACVVLCGAVLTSYVGVMGLCRRMANDGVLPAVLGRVNRVRGTPHWIILAFFVLTSCLFLLIFNPHDPHDMKVMGSVYSMAFLAVMIAFGLACMLLKLQRATLPRVVFASWPSLVASVALVIVGFIGNVVLALDVLPYFLLYLVGFCAVVGVMLYRAHLLRGCIWVLGAAVISEHDRNMFHDELTQLRHAHAVLERCQDQPDAGRRQLVALPRDPDGSWTSLPPLEAQAVERAHPQAVLARGESVVLRDCDKLGVGPLPTQGRGELERHAPAISIVRPVAGCIVWMLDGLFGQLSRVTEQPVVYFAKHGDLFTLNQAVAYVRENEATQRLVIVHVVDDTEPLRQLMAAFRPTNDQDVPRSHTSATVPVFTRATLAELLPALHPSVKLLCNNCAILDAIHLDIRIDCVVVRGTRFCPAAVQWVSEHLGIAANMMLMGIPGPNFPFALAALGGVRVAIQSGDAPARRAAIWHLSHVLPQAAANIRAVRGVPVAVEDSTEPPHPSTQEAGTGTAPASDAEESDIPREEFEDAQIAVPPCASVTAASVHVAVIADAVADANDSNVHP